MIYLTFLLWLLLTIIIEGAVILLIFRRRKFVYYSLLCNVLTNPALNLILLVSVYSFGISTYYPVLFLCEIIVVLVEGFVYKYICGFRFSKSIILSIVLNACGAGLIINHFI